MTKIHLQIATGETEEQFKKLIAKTGGDVGELFRRVLAFTHMISDLQDDQRTIIAQAPATDPGGKEVVIPNIWQ